MGIQTNCWDGIDGHMRKKNVLGLLKSPMAYVVTGFLFVISLFVFEYAFAKGTVDRAVLQELAKNSGAPTVNSSSATRNYTPAVRAGLISQADIDDLASRVASLNEEKLQLDNTWRIERNKHDSMMIRIEDSKKTIRLEMDEVLLNNSPRERLDELLGLHELLSKDEKEVAKRVSQIEEKLASHQLLLVQAKRDLDRMKTNYAAQQREQDIQRVQEITRFLDRELRFSEAVSFKCSPSKSLAACLNDYPLDARIQNWVQDHYQAALSEELADQIDQVRLSSDWYTTEVNRNFTEANMNLDGSVSAEVEVRANVVSRKMMACALLKAPADLCETQSVSLIVRSNKYGDQVYINDKSYGSTPLSLILDPGVYNVEVKYQGLTQKRTLTLEDNRHLNFVF